MNRAPDSATILIVDDEAENLNVLEAMLCRYGWNVRAFPDGGLALQASLEEPPDLVLLDVRMPVMDGYEFCRRFKANERLHRIPIIFLSAFSEASDKVKAFAAGGGDYVTKPFAEVEVAARIGIHLQLSRNQARLEETVRKRVAELTEAHRRLRVWDDAKTEWLNLLSHEMRTPLTGVFGITELLFMKRGDEHPLHELRQVYEASRNRIEKLVRDATTLAQLNVSTSEGVEVKSIPISAILGQALRLSSEQASPLPVDIISRAAPGVEVWGNQELFVRAMLDFLQTAGRCHDSEKPFRLEISLADEKVTLSILTCGRPLPDHALETFFEVGGQRMLLTGGGDFGLGAALAHRIFKVFGGRLSVRNAEGGLILELDLPACNQLSPAPEIPS
jgi:two-component system sensor histidine kinase/response regulator